MGYKTEHAKAGVYALTQFIILAKKSNTMRDEYDFSKDKRRPVVPSPGKTRITMMLDNDVIEAFREQAEAKGARYWTSINKVLRSYIFEDASLTENTIRQILRQESQKT